MKTYSVQIGLTVRWGNQIYEEVSPTLATSTGDNIPCVIYDESILRTDRDGDSMGTSSARESTKPISNRIGR